MRHFFLKADDVRQYTYVDSGLVLLSSGEVLPLISYGTVLAISDIRSRDLAGVGTVFSESSSATGPYKIGVIAPAGISNEEWIKSVAEEIVSLSTESLYLAETNEISTKNQFVISIRPATLLSGVLSEAVPPEKSLVKQLVFSLGGIIFLFLLFLILKTEKVIEDA